jgi:hypothetical protein
MTASAYASYTRARSEGDPNSAREVRRMNLVPVHGEKSPHVKSNEIRGVARLACCSEEYRHLERFRFNDVCPQTRRVDRGETTRYSVDPMQSTSQDQVLVGREFGQTF